MTEPRSAQPDDMRQDQTSARRPPSSSGRSAGYARLLKRADFLEAAKGGRFHAGSFSVQCGRRPDGRADDMSGARFGLTVTKKTGGAVIRNRIRRRLRAALRLAAAMDARADCDYVIVARAGALRQPFEALTGDLARAIARIGPEAGPTRGRKKGR